MYLLLTLKIFTPCFNVSIVNIEHVNAVCNTYVWIEVALVTA